MAPSHLLPHFLFFVPFLSLVVVTSAQSADVEIRINEEETVGTFVVNLGEFPSLFRDVSEENRQKLTFNILDQTGFDASFFSMDASTGVITMAKRLDREDACGTSDTCQLEFNVAIRGKDGFSFSNVPSVRVHVDDINDNSPHFPADQVVLEISEGAKVGTVLKLNGPRDRDSLPNNTVQRYELTLNEPIFTLTDTKNPDRSSFLYLRLETELDRETRPEYDFNVIAYDGGDPPRSDFLRIVIQVTDENDNAPKFEAAPYNVEIREDKEVGSDVVRVKATDKDAGEFGRVRYRFSSLTSELIHSLFQINATSGVISLQSPLGQRTSADPFSLAVEAYDGGDPPSVVQTVVTIRVRSTGNSAPVVRIVTLSEGDVTEVSLLESAKVNDFVAFVNVEDKDEGRGGEVTCSLVDTAQFRLVAQVNKGYQVLLSLPVDRETVSRYEATIACRDQGSPPRSTDTAFTVLIADVNDNDPVFDKQEFTDTVLENNAVKQYVLQASATDADSGENARLTYGFLEPEALDFLAVHPQSGIVTARRSFDREVTPELTFTLTAVDGGEAPRTGTASLRITVLDMNDNAPQLLALPYHFTVSEGATPGHVVGYMAATDVDESQNGQVEFFFAGSVNGEVPFMVYRNGTIAVSGVLDRETSESHVFTVLARDRGSIPKSNSTQVMITVTDINDNVPVILFPTNVNHSVVLTTLPEQGIVLARVIAYDIDEGNASSLVFAIHKGDPEGVFDIGTKSGEIFLTGLDKLRNPHTYLVVLRVYDGGFPPLFAETSLQIEMNYPNLTHTGPGDHHGEEDGPSRESYVIIVGVIGGATLVLSGIIIGAIFFVLRSERHRKSRDSASVLKNDYVPAPTKATPYSDRPDPVSSSKSPDKRGPSPSDFSSSGVILSPKGLPPQQRGEVQKKVSFSLDEPDADVMNIQSRDMFAAPPQYPAQSEVPAEAWKRLASPDDINSDTSGDSGTCDSGRGASDDDIHLDNSMDKHGSHQGPTLTNTNRTPAPANIYTPPTFTIGSFRQGQGHQGQGQFPSGSGSKPAAPPRPHFLHTGSYHEGRSDNYRGRGGGTGGHPSHPQRHHPHPHLPTFQQPNVVSLHPEPSSSSSSWRQSGSRHSLDFVESGRGDKWFPPRPPSSLSHQPRGSGGMHGGGLSMDNMDRDDASTTTSGSYTISPDELRLEGLVSPDVIV